MAVLLKVLVEYSCGLIDRLRGNGKVDVFYSKTIEALIYGLMVGALFLTVWWHVLIFAPLWALGASFGWGGPLGSFLWSRKMLKDDLEWWQFWIFKERPVFACILRGVIWGLCVVPLAWFNPVSGVFVFIMGAIFPGAIWLAKKFPYVDPSPWARQEFYRGWLVGLSALLLGLL